MHTRIILNPNRIVWLGWNTDLKNNTVQTEQCGGWTADNKVFKSYPLPHKILDYTINYIGFNLLV